MKNPEAMSAYVRQLSLEREDYLRQRLLRQLEPELKRMSPRDREAYLAGERMEELTRLTREDAMEETVMLATRTTRGLDLVKWKETFGADFIEPRRRKLDRLIAGGLIEINEGFLRLTLRGMVVQDAVVLELLNE